MDIGQMLAFHQAQRADVTVAALPVPVERASGFGVMVAEPDGRLVGFEEKPVSPPPMPRDPSRALASTGNYLVTRDALVDARVEDARRSSNPGPGRTPLPEHVPQAPDCA